jgi:hypothetical protein
MAPPVGPAAGPASAIKSSCKSCGSSPSAFKSLPLIMTDPALAELSVLTAGVSPSSTFTSCLTVSTRRCRSSVTSLPVRMIWNRAGVASSGAEAETSYAPAPSEANAYVPSAAVVVLSTPRGPCNKTTASPTAAPVWSKTRPRREAVCAAAIAPRKRKNRNTRTSFNPPTSIRKSQHSCCC